MKPSSRLLLVGAVIELILLAIGGYLLMRLSNGSLKPTTNAAEAARTVTTVLGTVVGGLGGVVVVLFAVLRSRGK